MNCVKCGFEVPDGGTFCPNCGARADGKKECVKCKSLINETAVYCTFCGARVDGKKVCDACGEVFDGKFCPKCGIKINDDLDDSENAYKETNNGAYSKIINIISPCLRLGLFLVLFICSFFIGTTTVLNGNKVTVNSFYFFSEAFKEAKILTQSAPSKMAGTLLFVLNAENVICLILIISNFILQTITIIFGTINSIKKLTKKSVKNDLYSLISFVSFFATALIVYGMYYVKVNGVSNDFAEINMSAAGVVGIIISAILLLADLVLKQVEKLKRSQLSKNLKKLIPLSCVLVMSIISTICANAGALSIDGCDVSVGSFLRIFALGIDKTVSKDVNSAFIVLQITMFTNVFGLLSLAFLIFYIIKEFNSRRSCKNGILTFNILSTIFITIVFILVIVLQSLLLNISGSGDIIKLSAGIVVAFITAVLSLAGSIVYKVINKEK